MTTMTPVAIQPDTTAAMLRAGGGGGESSHGGSGVDDQAEFEPSFWSLLGDLIRLRKAEGVGGAAVGSSVGERQ